MSDVPHFFILNSCSCLLGELCELHVKSSEFTTVRSRRILTPFANIPGTSYQDDPKIGVCKKSKLDYFPFNLNIVNSREQFNFDFANEHRYCKSNVVDVSDEKCSEANQLTILPPSSNKLSPLSRDLASNISVPTPLESIYTVSRMLWEDLTGSSKRRLQSVEEGREECVKHISKRQVKNAEKMLRAAFREFYRGLTLLASFRFVARALIRILVFQTRT